MRLFDSPAIFPLPAPFITNGAGNYAIWTSATVPEPSTLVLMGVGAAGLAAAGAARRKKKPVLTTG
jgi:PEP-CTERM motif